jgi:hypothetical protein
MIRRIQQVIGELNGMMMDKSLRHVEPNDNFPYEATYVTLHIPSGKTVERTRRFIGRYHLLELLDKWNAQQPANWKYWSKP